MGLLAPFFSVDEEGGVVARIGNNPNFGVDQFGLCGILAKAKIPNKRMM